MSPLPKHLRPRWRYLAVRIVTWPDAAIDREEFVSVIRASCQSLVGDVGVATAEVAVFEFTFGDGRGAAVVRVPRAAVETARAAIACVDDIGGHPVRLEITGVSGTVRGCEEKYLGRRGEAPYQSRVAFADAMYPAMIYGENVDIMRENAFVGATSLDLE